MGKKGTKRKTRWRVLPIGGEDGCNGVCSNEDEGDADRDSASPATQQRMPRSKSRGGNYNYRHRSYYQHPHETHQPLVTTEKKTFNEEEYTKITTPRQDVLFKKGYLGRKRPTAESTANVNFETTANGSLAADGIVEQNGEAIENEQTSSEMVSPVEEQPQYIYTTNGYVDQTGGPPPSLYYINGSGYELFDPYSGNVTVVVGPAPHYGGPGGGPPVLAAVPCQPLPLQPLEWFNPAFLPYVTAPCHNGLASARDRRKRYSTDSQNCSPQSSESTEPPGSPQECEMEISQPGEPPGPAMYPQPPAYVYPGYMFGPPMYSVNGVTVQGAPTQPPSCDVTGSNKRRKKKRRRRRRRGGAEDGCSEESSSDEKELEEPMSVTSQESSSQEIESDSKQSPSNTTVNESSAASPLSSCQTLTPSDQINSSIRLKTSTHESQAQFVVENISAPSAGKDSCSQQNNSNLKVLVKEEQVNSQHCNEQEADIIKDNNRDLNSIHLLKDQTESEESVLHSSLKTSGKCKENTENKKSEDTVSQCNGVTNSCMSYVGSIKSEDTTKVPKQKKAGKQSNFKNKKNTKGKEDKQKRLTKAHSAVCNSDTAQVSKKKKDDIAINAIPVEDVNVTKETCTSKSNMDGNENKPVQSTSAKKDITTGESKESYDKPPTKPNRKEKQKLASTNSKPPDHDVQQAAAVSSITVKSVELPQISLRPDVPKIQYEVASSSQQFKDAKDVLHSITEALITEPSLQSTAQKLKSETSTPEENISDLEFASSLEIPVPPPRCKKQKLVELTQAQVLDSEIGDTMEESFGDSSTSTTHESEESVIELLSSTHTNPDDRPKQDSSSDEEENIIFTGSKPDVKSETVDIKSVPPDKSDNCTPSISDPSHKESSQISEQDKPSESKSSPSFKTKEKMSEDTFHSAAATECVELFADELSKNIVSEAVHESARKRVTLPITEAVTRWLRSQSPEVLSLPPPEDETESDASSEEQENDKSGETNKNKQEETGQKNVLCNPLPVPLLEDCNHMLVNDNINHSGCINGTGRRVALNQNIITHVNDNNKIDAFAPMNLESKRLIPEDKDGEHNFKIENKYNAPSSSNRSRQSYENNCIDSMALECNYVKRSTKKDSSKLQDICRRRTFKQLENKCGNSKSNFKDEEELSFTSEETLECEWDLWECEPPVKNPTPVDDILRKTPEDYCSQMCDPTISVAKYYSLGALQPKDKKSAILDEEETNSVSSSEEMDALKHFQYELEDDDGLQPSRKHTREVEREAHGEDKNARNAYNTSLSRRAHAASSILVSRLKGEGPFPCGGICCILQ